MNKSLIIEFVVTQKIKSCEPLQGPGVRRKKDNQIINSEKSPNKTLQDIKDDGLFASHVTANFANDSLSLREKFEL